eukprot:5257063-Pyramimonas_sp.AAC.1
MPGGTRFNKSANMSSSIDKVFISFPGWVCNQARIAGQALDRLPRGAALQGVLGPRPGGNRDCLRPPRADEAATHAHGNL